MKAAVFLDRDGVINKEVEFLRKLEQFELLPKSCEAIKLLNDHGWLVVIITNQPVIARGEATARDIDAIHKKMKNKLKKCGAHIDAIYYCPHHPEQGFPGEMVEYKIDCACRKPKIGLLEEASKEFNIDLKKSFFVGDTTVDVQTGKNAGCKTILVKTGYGGLDKKFPATPVFTCEDLLEAAKLIIDL
jgi:histidinol-phosphate phosphatase family protein